MIRAGEADIIIAGGMESMTNAPYLLPGARAGYRIGDQKVVDSMMFDGLTCAFDQCAMGLATERYNHGQISRARQDEFSRAATNSPPRQSPRASSPRRSSRVAVPQRKGDPIIVTPTKACAATPRSSTRGQLRAAFEKDGTITAGNASQISDGGAAVLVMSEERARTTRVSRHSANSSSYGQVAGPDTSLLTQPSRAIFRRRKKAEHRRPVHRSLRDQRGVRRGRDSRRPTTSG